SVSVHEMRGRRAETLGGLSRLRPPTKTQHASAQLCEVWAIIVRLAAGVCQRRISRTHPGRGSHLTPHRVLSSAPKSLGCRSAALVPARRTVPAVPPRLLTNGGRVP